MLYDLGRHEGAADQRRSEYVSHIRIKLGLLSDLWYGLRSSGGQRSRRII